MRVTDHASLEVLTAQFTLEIVERVVFETERLGERERDLPAHVIVYYAIRSWPRLQRLAHRARGIAAGA